MKITTPCHIIDLDALKNNLEKRIGKIKNEADCNILLALKGFSTPYVLNFMREYLDGISASGAFEARLGKEIIKKHVCTYSPVYLKNEIDLITENTNNLVFNSMHQFNNYSALAKSRNCSCGIRINPEYSSLPNSFRANPCQKNSRLGIIFEQMPPLKMFDKGMIEGIHFHTMCDQYTEDLENTVEFIIKKYEPYLRRIKWLNLGGGQMYAHKDYDISSTINTINKLHKLFDFDIFIEPCSGIMTNVGYFVTSVIDIVNNGMDIAIIDSSAVCHMPDVVFNEWYHDVLGADLIDKHPHKYRITGSSCYAGDIWGDYSFTKPLSIGDYIIFEDTAMYSMVKNNYFNGLCMPSVKVYSKENGLKTIKTYNYKTFLSSL